jgi:hypothetical protein
MIHWEVRTVIPAVWKMYVGIGMPFGLLLEGSYLWGSTFGSPAGIGLFGHLMLFVVANLVGVCGFVLRTILWFPSLIHWYFFSDQTFILWLMPGLFVEVGYG